MIAIRSPLDLAWPLACLLTRMSHVAMEWGFAAQAQG